MSTGLRRAGASTGRGAAGLRHPVATDTVTYAGAPGRREAGGDVGDGLGEGRGLALGLGVAAP